MKVAIVIDEGNYTLFPDGYILGNTSGKQLKIDNKNTVSLYKDGKYTRYNIKWLLCKYFLGIEDINPRLIEVIDSTKPISIDNIQINTDRLITTPIKPHPIFIEYASDENGNIFSLVSKMKMLTSFNTAGYLMFNVHDNGAQTSKMVHRFSYECFNGEIKDPTLVINHKDGIKTNNRLNNLELCSQKENVAHAKEYGLITTKLTKADILEIRDMAKRNLSCEEIHNKFSNVTKSHIYHILANKSWKELV